MFPAVGFPMSKCFVGAMRYGSGDVRYLPTLHCGIFPSTVLSHTGRYEEVDTKRK